VKVIGNNDHPCPPFLYGSGLPVIFLLKSVIFKILFETGTRFKNSGQTLIENL